MNVPKSQKLPKVTWDRKYDLGYVYLYNPEVVKRFRIGSREVRTKYGRLIVDYGSNGEVLGIESLWASKHFPKWVLDQAEIIG